MPVTSGERQKGRPSATPWKKMMTHTAIWAIIVNNFTFHYAFYVVMNWLPTYFDQVDIPSVPQKFSGTFSIGCHAASLGIISDTLTYILQFVLTFLITSHKKLLYITVILSLPCVFINSQVYLKLEVFSLC